MLRADNHFPAIEALADAAPARSATPTWRWKPFVADGPPYSPPPFQPETG
jgi:hypothetical protein